MRVVDRDAWSGRLQEASSRGALGGAPGPSWSAKGYAQFHIHMLECNNFRCIDYIGGFVGKPKMAQWAQIMPNSD